MAKVGRKPIPANMRHTRVIVTRFTQDEYEDLCKAGAIMFPGDPNWAPKFARRAIFRHAKDAGRKR